MTTSMLTAETIAKYLPYTLEKTGFDFLGERKQGKVRDVYDDGEHFYLIATDRYSAFDRNLTLIPLKGQILTQTSLFNFKQTEDIIGNHIIENPDPNVLVCKKCTVAPIEVIVRGYLTGVTETSIWTRYERGQRDFTDFELPDGMVKNTKLEQPVLTPTTKFEEHDRNLSFSEIISEGHLTEEKWKEIRDVALDLFVRGQEVAEKAGLILVDTKYEFGYDENGALTLVDEIHTQDSSRYWKADSYEERMAAGEEPEYFDKEFLRLWFKEQCDPYNDETLPDAPEDMRVELARRYAEIYEKLTGGSLQLPPLEDIAERITNNLKN
ncbi:phosphoribosylaminoimidazolesuccinocarboxamide synthase [Candidatus Kaiserbacteria bacterium]|nr:phosphoribosylaminoimidazolesuccinocarboxamide synthase [Candidatus Kaiserbacteria bacterium]